MVNLTKWEEIDFFDIKLDDEIKGYIKVGPTLTEVVKGTVVYVHTTSDKAEGRIHVEKDWENHALIRDRDKGKPENTVLYRRKNLTQDERDELFEFPEKLGAIVSAVGRNLGRYGTQREHFVWDGGEWSTAHTSQSSSELKRDFKEFKLIRKGIKVG
jgi:hypothetical protein